MKSKTVLACQISSCVSCRCLHTKELELVCRNASYLTHVYQQHLQYPSAFNLNKQNEWMNVENMFTCVHHNKPTFLFFCIINDVIIGSFVCDLYTTWVTILKVISKTFSVQKPGSTLNILSLYCFQSHICQKGLTYCHSCFIYNLQKETPFQNWVYTKKNCNNRLTHNGSSIHKWGFHCPEQQKYSFSLEERCTVRSAKEEPTENKIIINNNNETLKQSIFCFSYVFDFFFVMILFGLHNFFHQSIHAFSINHS